MTHSLVWGPVASPLQAEPRSQPEGRVASSPRGGSRPPGQGCVVGGRLTHSLDSEAVEAPAICVQCWKTAQVTGWGVAVGQDMFPLFTLNPFFFFQYDKSFTAPIFNTFPSSCTILKYKKQSFRFLKVYLFNYTHVSYSVIF